MWPLCKVVANAWQRMWLYQAGAQEAGGGPCPKLKKELEPFSKLSLSCTACRSVSQATLTSTWSPSEISRIEIERIQVNVSSVNF